MDRSDSNTGDKNCLFYKFYFGVKDGAELVGGEEIPADDEESGLSYERRMQRTRAWFDAWRTLMARPEGRPAPGTWGDEFAKVMGLVERFEEFKKRLKAEREGS